MGMPCLSNSALLVFSCGFFFSCILVLPFDWNALLQWARVSLPRVLITTWQEIYRVFVFHLTGKTQGLRKLRHPLKFVVNPHPLCKEHPSCYLKRAEMSLTCFLSSPLHEASFHCFGESITLTGTSYSMSALG